MSINGVQNTSFPLTLSGLTLTDDLSSTYIPYAGANNSIDLNNKAVSNVASLAVNTTASVTNNTATGSLTSVPTTYEVALIQVLTSNTVLISTVLSPSSFIVGATIKVYGFNTQPVFNTSYVITSLGMTTVYYANFTSGLPVAQYYTSTARAFITNGSTGSISCMNLSSTIDITAPIGNITTVNATSVSATGAVSGATVSASGAISGASVSATGAISGASLASTGAITGTSLTITEAGIGKKFLAGEYFNVPVIQVLNSTQVAISFYAPAYPSIFPVGTVIKVIGFPVQTILNTTYTVVSVGSWSGGIAFVYASFSGLPVGFYYGDLTTYMYKYDDVTYGNLGGINLFCVNTVTGDYLWARNQALLNNMTATGITSISGTGNITSTNLTATGTVSTATLTATGTTTLATTNITGNTGVTGSFGVTGAVSQTGGTQTFSLGAYGSSGDYIIPTTNIYGSTVFDGFNGVNIQNQASQYGRNILFLTGRYELSNDAWSWSAPRNAIIFRTQANLNSSASIRYTIQNFFQELGIMCAGKGSVPITKWSNNGTMTHTDNMTIGGTVGIGNTAPLYALTVGTGSGTVMTSIIRIQNGYYTNGEYGMEMRGIDNGVNGHDLQFWGRTTASGAFNNIVTIKNTGTIASMKTTTGVPTVGIWGGNGDRIVLAQGSASAYPYSIGINSSEMWFGLPAGAAYRWYSGTNTMMVLDNFQLGINILSPLCRLDVVGSANIWTGTRYAIPNGFMALGSLTIGSTNTSYGGGSNWTSNTAGFMLETNSTQEIMVHHSGVRLASLLYYNPNNYIYIGRDCGYGATNTSIEGFLYIAQGKRIHWEDVTINNTNGISWAGNTASHYSITKTSGNWDAPNYQQLLFQWDTGFIFTCNGNNYGKSYVDFQCQTKVSNGDNSITVYGPNSSWGAYLSVGSGTQTRINSTTAQVLSTDGNLHLDCATGKSMYLNYYSANCSIMLGGRFVGMDTQYHNFGRTSYANNQAIIADFNNFGGNWIGATFGSTLCYDRVVAGGLNSSGNFATIGAHNYNLTAWATLSVANPSFWYPSDETLKENVNTADYNICYDNIKKLRVARYNYKTDGPARALNKHDKTVLGIIAQELQVIFPKSISEQEDPESKDKFLTVNTDQLNFCTLGAVKHMQEIIEQQANTINTILEHLKQLTTAVNKLSK